MSDSDAAPAGVPPGVPPGVNETAGTQEPDAPDPEPADRPPGTDARPFPLDPEDWASAPATSDEERYLRERPPHWQ